MSILRGAGVKHERRECEIYRDVFSDKRKGTGCKGRNVKAEELLKFGDAARIVVKDDGIEIL